MNQRKLLIGSVFGVVVLAGIGMGAFLASLTDADIEGSQISEKKPSSPRTTSGEEASGEPLASPAASSEKAGLYITTMTHMEGNFADDTVEALFLRHVDQIRWAMDLFDEYGAKLTIESEQSFAIANTKWDVNILQEIVDRDHGVGTHADFGASLREKNVSLEELTQNFIENKALVDALVGAENNRGVSGGTSYADWVLGASAAGFEYMDATTGFGYLSMSEDVRPDGWTDEYIRSVGYHDPIPLEFADRLYPLPLANAEDLVPDEDFAMVIMGGDIGELASLAEGRNNCFPDCTFDDADVQAVADSIEEAMALRDDDRMARINMHIPLTLLKEENEATLRKLLSIIQTYVDAEELTWVTQGESYDAFAGE